MLDFAAIKAQVSITEVAHGLGLELKQEGQQFRTACPVCEGGPRTIVITPDRNLFFCFLSKVGGDQIALFAHCRNMSMKEAANEISPKEEKPKGFDTKQYLEALKPIEDIPPELQKKVGIGRAVKGAHAGKIVVALRDATGAIIVFASVTGMKLPAKWSPFPEER